MKEDLLMEYMKFKSVGDIQIARVKSDHEKHMIKYRLELLKRRFDSYDTAGFDLDKVRKLEGERYAMLVKLNQAIYEPKPIT